MSKKEVKQEDVGRMVTSLAIAVENDGHFDHLQFSIFRAEDGKYRCFFDVVDPSKVKLSEENND